MLLTVELLLGVIAGFALALLSFCRICGQCATQERFRASALGVIAFAFAVWIVLLLIGKGPFPQHIFAPPPLAASPAR